MTRTEDDLRTLLHAPLDADAASRLLHRVVLPARRRRRGRIATVAVVAVTLVVGAVLAVVAIRPASDSEPRPPAADVGNPPASLSVDGLVVSFAGDAPFRTASTATYENGQSVGVTRVGSNAVVASVRVVEAGVRPPVEPVPGRAAVPLTAGVTATWVTTDVGAPIPAGDSLRWTVGLGLVVTVVPSPGEVDDDRTVAVAQAVRIGASRSIRVPVSSAAWPAEWTVTSVVRSDVAVDNARGGTGRDVRIEVTVAGSPETAVVVEASDTADARVHAGDGDPEVIAGRSWGLIPTANVFSWRGPDWSLRVMATNGAGGHRTVPDDRLRAFIAGLSLTTDFADESAWFDATTALPS